MKKIGSIALRNVTLMQAVTELTRLQDVRCVVPAQLQNRRVTVDLSDVTAMEALRAIVAAAQCELVPLGREGKVWTLRERPGALRGVPAGAAAKPPVLHPADRIPLPLWQVETVALAHDCKGDGGFSPPYLLVKLVAGAS